MSQTIVEQPTTHYAPGTWNIDTAHTEVGFTVRHMMISKVRGNFTQFSGSVQAAANPLDSGVEVTVDMASIATGNPQRDDHLRSTDFFGTAEHPTMTYRAKGVEVVGDHYRLNGELSLKGTTRVVPVDFEVTGSGPDAYGGLRMGFSGSAEISRSDFGVTWNQAIETTGGAVVGDKVTIHLEVQVVREA